VLKGANLIGVDLSTLALCNSDVSESVRVDDSPEAWNKLQDMIAAHARWVETGGAAGARAEFVRADLSGLDLSGSRLVGAVFREARLRGTKLIGASLNLCSFVKTDLTGADLSQAELRGVRFEECVLNGVSLCGADLGVETVRLSATKSAGHPSLISACQLAKTNFTGAKGQGLVTRDVDLGRIVADAAFHELLRAPRSVA
jgi:uncharacterized protein YjbI with pentapeptide repeats